MFADPLGEENLFGDHVLAQFVIPPLPGVRVKSNIANCKGNMKNRSGDKKVGGNPNSGFRLASNPGSLLYLAAVTELTSMVSPFASPFTVAFAVPNFSS